MTVKNKSKDEFEDFTDKIASVIRKSKKDNFAGDAIILNEIIKKAYQDDSAGMVSTLLKLCETGAHRLKNTERAAMAQVMNSISVKLHKCAMNSVVDDIINDNFPEDDEVSQELKEAIAKAMKE